MAATADAHSLTRLARLMRTKVDSWHRYQDRIQHYITDDEAKAMAVLDQAIDQVEALGLVSRRIRSAA